MTQTVFEKHPRVTIFAVILVLLVFIAASAEIILRFTTTYDIGYYTAVRKEGVYHYPYGDILINKDWFPDTDFDHSSKKPRIGYMGDSIMMGVGAGHGYRISDILEKRYPAYEHWTFGLMGNGLEEDQLVSLTDEYKLDKIIYGLNLNDFLPPLDDKFQPEDGSHRTIFEKSIQKIKWTLHFHFDWLRGRSYLYTVARTGAKNILQSFGIGHMGFRAAEFYPRENEELIRNVALRFNRMATQLANKNVDLCLVIFPYEMQISKQAAKTYADLGIHWEEGFEGGSTQALFLKYLDIPHVYDARRAFANTPDSATGTYFVYNKGDKIDFNHPNREGHALITQGLIKSGACAL